MQTQSSWDCNAGGQGEKEYAQCTQPHSAPERVPDLEQVLSFWGNTSALEALPGTVLPWCPGPTLLPQGLLKCQEVKHSLHCPEAPRGRGLLPCPHQGQREMNFKDGGEAKISCYGSCPCLLAELSSPSSPCCKG